MLVKGATGDSFIPLCRVYPKKYRHCCDLIWSDASQFYADELPKFQRSNPDEYGLMGR